MPPPVLLVNPKPDSMDAFTKSGIWSITVAANSHDKPDRNPPDPAQWTLAIASGWGVPDDLRRTAERLQVPFFRMDRQYLLRDAENCSIVEVGCQDSLTLSGLHFRRAQTYKKQKVEATEHAFVKPLQAWVAEYGSHFMDGYLEPADGQDGPPPRIEEVFRGPEGPAITWVPERRVLAMPYFRDSVPGQAMTLFASRVAPRIWPNVRGGTYTPRSILVLEAERAFLESRQLLELANIDQIIGLESRFWRQWEGLITLTDDALVAVAKKFFEDILGLRVVDLDERAVLDGGPKLTDLYVENKSGFCVEVTGRPMRALKREDLETGLRHQDATIRRYPDVSGRLIMMSNAFFERENRATLSAFDSQLVALALEKDVTLVDTLELMSAIDKLRLAEVNAEDIVERLNTPGVFKV